MKVVPIRFEGLDCPACGESNCIRFIDRLNKASSDIDDTIQGAYEARCIFCNYEYTLRWDKDKYMLEDASKKFNGFIENYTDCTKRDIDQIAARIYELPKK